MNRLIEKLRRAAASAEIVFCKMARIQYSAPWRSDRGYAC